MMAIVLQFWFEVSGFYLVSWTNFYGKVSALMDTIFVTLVTHRRYVPLRLESTVTLLHVLRYRYARYVP